MRSICANIRKSGGIKEGDNFSDCFHYFSFSHKLIRYFVKVVGNSFVIMHSDMHSSSQLPITGCFGTLRFICSVLEGRKGLKETKQKILRFLEV